MEKKVTLGDIAEKLHVSCVTVSNALAGRSGVSEKLREQILLEAEALGYQRPKRREKQKDSGRRRSRSGRKVGVVVEEKYLPRFQYTSFYWEMYKQVAVEASKSGCLVLLEFLSPHQEEKGELPGMVEEKQVEGLIILGRIKRDYLKMLRDKAGLPMVTLDFHDGEIPCDAVVSNNFYGMYQMTNYLISRGLTRMGYVGECRATESIMDRYQGYSKSLLEHGILENPKWLWSDREADTGKLKIELPGDIPQALVCNSDLTANMVAEKLMEHGLRIPEDVSIVGYDGFLIEGEMRDKLTTYEVDKEAMARQAMNRLLKRMDGDTGENLVRTVEGKIVIRESTR